MSQEQWYPGHISKAKRKIRSLLKESNSIILVLDSRAPYSSMAFDEFNYLKTKKNLLIILNKSDLADPIKTKEWENYFLKRSFNVLTFSLKQPVKRSKIIEKIKLKGKITKVMIVGIPNVGKSTILNYLDKRKFAKTGNKAGVTRGIQWAHLDDTTILLDTPGILFAKVSNDDLFQKLFYIKAVNVDKLDIVERSYELIDFLRQNYPDVLGKLYFSNLPSHEYLKDFCFQKNFIMRGGQPDLQRGALYIYNLATNGKLGRISYESVYDEYVK
jgi:ribosome biogenesis GTPase A